MLEELLRRLDDVPAMGWIDGPTPITALPELAGELGLSSLCVKRDDLCPALLGGTKVRKLDYLLAEPRYAEAEGWISVGGIGSGQLSTLASAARQLEKRLEVVMFWQSPTERVLEDLAFTASNAARVRFHKTRLGLALRRPGLLLTGHHRRLAVVPPGATTATADLGLVRAGLELAEQIAAGELPEPDRIVVPLGSGGTVSGLAWGLALAGLQPELHAVCAVERPLSSRRRLARLLRDLRDRLAELEISGLDTAQLPRIRIDRSQVGRRYGSPKAASREAVERLGSLGVDLEPIYSGRAAAALLARAQDAREHVLFWLTPRRAEPPPVADDWRDRLPRSLARRLPTDRKRLISRRRVLIGAAGVAAVTSVVRFTGYPSLPDWQGEILSAREAAIIGAAAEALLPPAPLGQSLAAVAPNVDRYLVGMPSSMIREIHLLLFAIEHATTPLTFRWSRLTRLSAESREEYLSTLSERGGLQATMYRGIRDLCMLGYYQQRATWLAIEYSGPREPAGVRSTSPYDDLLAEPSARPRSLVAEERS